MTQEPRNANKSHIVVYAILGAVILGMTLLCLQLYMQANAPRRTVTVVQQVPVNVPYPADIASIKTAIERETAKLAVKKPDTKDFTYQKALDTRAAIKKGDYATAKMIAQDVLSRSKIRSWDFYPFDIYMWQVSDLNDPSYINHLNTWVDAENNQATPILIRAQYYFDAAWRARGNEFARSVVGAHMDNFSDLLSNAFEDVEKAIHLGNTNPYAYSLKLHILGSNGDSKALRGAFEDAVAQFPSYYDLYSTVLDRLVPKWGGSIETMRDFVDEYAGKAPEHSPLKLLYFEQYGHLINTAYITGCFESDGTAQKECVETYASRLITPALEKNVVKAFDLYKYTDKYEFGQAIYQTLDNMVLVRGASKLSNAILQLVANAMDVQIQAKDNNPGHNNHVLDVVAGHIWQGTGYYDAAEAKYNEALLDLNNTAFPNDEGRAKALASIYWNLSDLFLVQKDYVKAIVYQNAAFTAGGEMDVRVKDKQCEAYKMLRMYVEAVEACTVVFQASGDYGALWGRAKVYRAMHKTDEAIADLSIIADAENRYRALAVLEMSVIYGDQKDHKKMLDVLSQYDFSYDVTSAGKHNVSVAYNNRCYANMQLGNLEKALADCTEALKYDSMPDIYQKQQKLISMLKEKGK